MSTERSTQPSIGIAEGTSAAVVGAGTVTLALFPLAIPIVVLTAVFVLPLMLVGLAASLVVAVAGTPILLVRRQRRNARRAGTGGRQAAPRLHSPGLPLDPDR